MRKNRRTYFFLLVLMIILSGCDTADERSIETGFSDSRNSILVLNNLSETVSVLASDGSIHNHIARTGSCPNDIVTDDGFLYIVNSLSNSLLVLDAGNLRCVREIALGAGKNPYYMALVRKGIVAVTEFARGTVDIVDTRAGKIIASIDLTGIELPTEPGTNHSRFCYPQAIAVTGGSIFVGLSNLTPDMGGLTSAGPGVLVVIDAITFEIEKTIELAGYDPVYAGSFASSVIVSSAGHYEGGFRGDGTIEVLDAKTLEKKAVFELEAAPFSFSITDTGILHASNALTGGIPRIDLNTMMILDNLEVPGTYISDVCVTDEFVYALDFEGDLMYRIAGNGEVVSSHLTGDGPIAMIEHNVPGTPPHNRTYITALPELGSIGNEVFFTTTNENDVSWDFGDGNTSPVKGPGTPHVYESAGTFTVSLISNVTSETLAQTSVQILENSPFATRVVDYSPAPGQFTGSNSIFTNPHKALGAPVGGFEGVPDHSSVVSLGGFAGSITLGFDHEVTNGPGYDFIVFGNSFVTSKGRASEPGTVEIATSGEGPWYLIPGSALKKSPTSPAYAKTTKDFGDGIVMSGYMLPADVKDVLDGGTYSLSGYADLNPTIRLPGGVSPLDFYTFPDDPFVPGIDEGSGGGDPFDIGWAVDPETGNPAGLDSFTYIRISTGQDKGAADTGEVSTEINAVSDID